MKKRFLTTILLAGALSVSSVQAQLSSNPDKFLGNITTSGKIDFGSEKYYQLWNQITPENETKWGSVQGGGQTSWNWSSVDNINNYAKQHNFPFKFHTLVWGSQYPNWLKNLSIPERYEAIVTWMDAVKARYPNLAMIDVVNEAVSGHQADTYLISEALGGPGKTGYDWIIKAFEMAGERWPNAILIYNDFNTFQWNTDQFIDLVRTLRDAGAPVDAYGCQSHDLTNCTATNFKNAMVKLQNALKMPMYSTEYDIGTSSDSQQLQRYKEQIPYMWEADYCAGITLWGYIYGRTWTTDGNSGIIKDGADRPAMTWLREYMQSDAAKTAKSPFPGMKKEASVYIHPAALNVAKGDILPVMVRASMATKTIEKVELYLNSTLIATMKEAPYVTEFTAPASTGWKTLKAVVTATDGSTYERTGRFQVLSGTTKREPYSETVPQFPGTINTIEYDKGVSGVSYENATRSLTATKDGQWMEYTVDVKEDGFYSMDAEVASTKTGGVFHLSEYSFENLAFLTSFIEVPSTGSTTEYQTVRTPMKEYLTAGRHVFCLNIDKGGFLIKSLTLKHIPNFVMPGTVEAEDFYLGGDGVSVINANEGFVVSNATTGKWMDYRVNIQQEGKYSYEATVSSGVTGSAFRMTLIDEEGNEKTLGTVTVPQTAENSWDTYTVVSKKIRNTISGGQQTLRLTATGGNCNIDKIVFTCTQPTAIQTIAAEDTDAAVYNIYGMKVGTVATWNSLPRGLYVVDGKKTIKK